MSQRDLWNERYEQKGHVWGAAPNQFVADRLAGLAPRRVLDFGSGQGRNAIWLAQQGHAVTAVDVSDVATRQAADLAKEAGVTADFVTADLAIWDPPAEAFELVLLAYLHAPEESRKAVHGKAKKALVPGGHVFIIAHHRDNLTEGIGGPPIAEMLFDEEMLAVDFAGFEVVENARVLRPVSQGDVAGDAIDVIFFARKPQS
ncbi:MAG: methyltransferase domain-containing protein [Acidimicrobiia bacterium]|nr:methyltransferase domain-containing protein [Acidimicrobiia bacterium]